MHRIGNLTLLGRQDNKPGDTDNRDFFIKRDAYAKSAVQLTRDVGTCPDWSPGRISDRQKKLAARAARVWSFGEGMG